MRILNVSKVLCATALALLGVGGAARADGWMVQGPVVYRSYYAAAPVMYSHACHPVYATSTMYAPPAYAPQTYSQQPYTPQTYSQQNYAPQTYSQQPYGSAQGRAGGYAPARPTTSATVAAYDNYFEPKTINVQPGTTVRWINRGRHPHTVTDQNDRWDSGDIPPGASYTATFLRPGTYYYYCRHHTDDKMQGTIVVGGGGGYGGQGAYGEGATREGGAGAARGDGYGGGTQGNGGARAGSGGGRSSGY